VAPLWPPEMSEISWAAVGVDQSLGLSPYGSGGVTGVGA
jgi:hypothetical protein